MQQLQNSFIKFFSSANKRHLLIFQSNLHQQHSYSMAMGIHFFHIFSLAICSSGLWDCFHQQLPSHLLRGGHYQFLTNISLMLTMAYIILSMFHIKCPTFYNAVTNLEFAVTVTYWMLFLIFPHLLNTKTLPPTFQLDFKIHLWPYLYLLVLKERSSINGVALSGVILIIYSLYVELIVATDSTGVSKFAYPFLNKYSFSGRFVWMLAIWAISSANYIVLRYIKRI